MRIPHGTGKPDPRLGGLLLLALGSFACALFLGIWRIAVIRGFDLPGVPTYLPPHGQWMVGGFLAALIMMERFMAFPVRGLIWVPYLYVITALFLPRGEMITRALHGIALFGWWLHRHRAARHLVPSRTPYLESLAYTTLSVALLHPLGFAQRWDLSFSGLLFAALIIAGERLEFALQLHQTMARWTAAGLALLSGWAITSMIWGPWPAPLWGIFLVVLGLGLTQSDHTLKRAGLQPKEDTSGFRSYLRGALAMAYGWWFLTALSLLGWNILPAAVRKDIVFHGLGLGFIFTMILAHAPMLMGSLWQGRMPHRGPWRALLIFQASTLFRLGADLNIAHGLSLWAWSGWTSGVLHFVALIDLVITVRRTTSPQDRAVPSPTPGSRQTG